MTNHLRTQLFRAKLPVVSSCNSSTQQLEDLPLVRRLQGLAATTSPWISYTLGLQ